MSTTDLSRREITLLGKKVDVVRVEDMKTGKDIEILDPEIFKPFHKQQHKLFNPVNDSFKKLVQFIPANEINIKQIKNLGKDERYAKMIQYMDDLYRGKHSRGVSYTASKLAKLSGLSENTINKFYDIVEQLSGTRSDTGVEVEIEQFEDPEFKEFKKDPHIAKWIEIMTDSAKGKDEQKSVINDNVRKMYYVLKELEMLPKDWLQKDVPETERDGIEKFYWIRDKAKSVLPAMELIVKANAEARGKRYKKTGLNAYKRAMRSFTETGITVIPHRQPDSSPFNYSVTKFVGKYKSLRAEKSQFFSLKGCLSNKVIEDMGKIETDWSEKDQRDEYDRIVNELKTGENYTSYSKKRLEKGNNSPTAFTFEKFLERKKDAYFIFLLALEMGFRAEEFFTISTKTVGDQDPRDEDAQSGVKPTETGDQFYVTIRTRKSDWIGMRVHKVLVQDEETNGLIRHRLEDIQKNIGVAKSYRIGKEDIKNIKNAHSLIGFDNEYTNVGTLQDKKPKTNKVMTDNRSELKEIFRQCYYYSKLFEDYFTERPFHSLRHIFAQYWMIKSNYDYDFIATLGHWKTLSVLKSSYAEPDPIVFYQKQKHYHQNPFLTSTELATLTPEEKKKYAQGFEAEIVEQEVAEEKSDNGVKGI